VLDSLLWANAHYRGCDLACSLNGGRNHHRRFIRRQTQRFYSCPPDDKYVGDLKQRDNVISLADYLDYWDHTGWKVSFSTPTSTQRQRGYSKAMDLWSIYTPQAVNDRSLQGVAAPKTSNICLVTYDETNTTLIPRDENAS
jgi:hypothetical protein